MGYLSYQTEKVATKGLFGLLVYFIVFSLIAVAVIAAAGLIALVVVVMLLVSLCSVSIALWRRHVLHRPGPIGQLRPAGTKPTEWTSKTKRQGQVARQGARPALPSGPAPATPSAPTSWMPKRVTQAWIIPHAHV